MLNIVNPSPTTSDPNALLVFFESSMTATRLYSPGTDSSADAIHVVTNTKAARRVTVSRDPRGGDALLAEVRYPNDLQRLVRNPGSVRFDGEGGREVALDKWLTKVKKGEGEYGRMGVILQGGGVEYAWAERLTNLSASTKVYTLMKDDSVLVTFVPTRTTGRPASLNRVMTRAYLEFTDGGLLSEDQKDEVVVSLLVLQHLIRTGGSTMPGTSSFFALFSA